MASGSAKVSNFNPGDSWRAYVSPDLNGLGRIFAYIRWSLDNMRIRIVGHMVTGMLLLILGVTIFSSATGVYHIREVKDFWNHFDVGTSSVYDLGRKLESETGSHNLFAEILRLSVNPGHEQIMALEGRIDEIKGLIASIKQAEPTEEETRALDSLWGSLDRISARIPSGSSDLSAQKLAALQKQALEESDQISSSLQIITGTLSDSLADGGRRVGNILDDMAAGTTAEIAINGFLLVLLSIFFFWFANTRLSKPLKAIGETMTSLAEGDKTVAIPYLDKADEIGEMSRAVAVFKDTAHQVDNIMEEQRGKAKEERDRRRKMMDLTSVFEGDIENVVKAVAGAAHNLDSLSSHLAELVTEQDESTQSAAEASEGSVEKAALVASAATELTSSIAEIAQRIEGSMQVATKAAEETEAAQQVMHELQETSERIEQITELINEIAENISLLALNATIEAQRAGEAGRGFAVVASEVKNLSMQTRDATDQVAEQINAIKRVSTNAGSAIGRVSEVIEKIHEYSMEISSAITEQQSSTDEISRSIDLLATEAELVKNVIFKVAETGKGTGEASKNVRNASQLLNSSSDDLASQVSSFLARIQE